MPIGGLIALGTSLIGGAIQNHQQRKMMEEQKLNQMELNEQGQELGMKTFRETGIEAKARAMDRAGMNRAMMYGTTGDGGGTTTTGSGGSASGGQAANIDMPKAMGIGLQAEALASEIAVNKAQAEKLKAEAGLVGENTTTVKDSREIMIENMKQSGIAQWFENMKTQALKDGADKDGNITIFENKTYGKGEQGYSQESPEMQKFQAELFKTEAEKSNLDANALLTNEKAKGYWQELLNATENADSNRINAIAHKLSAEWHTGEFTNWKTWVDLGMKAVQTASGLIKGSVNINKNETMTQYGDRTFQMPNKE